MIVKICGMTRREDAEAASRLGASWLGFIFHPKSPRNVTPAFAASIDGRALGILKVGVFVSQTADEVRRIMNEARLDLAQLHGGQNPEFCRAVGPERVIRVFWPQRHASRAELEAELRLYADCATWFLLDAGTSGGGHGQSLDFGGLAGIASPRPWLLAGGLSDANLAEALRARPAGVDLNSGVESAPGIKDHDKLAAAFAVITSCSTCEDSK